MKRCFKCHEDKPLTEFYRHPRMASGLLGKCKQCTRRDVQENYAAKREQYQSYDRARYAERYARGDFRPRDSQKAQARLALQSHVARGLIARGPCAVCGEPNAHAHHTDYTKPLEVVWLCQPHHAMAHRMDAERRTA